MRHVKTLLGLAVIGGTLACALPSHAATTVYFRDNDRTVLRSYVTQPTGTTETVTTYYQPGTTIPGTVTYTTLPNEVTAQLAPAPEGDQYVVIGSNAYLIDPDKRVVIDATRVYGDDDEDHEEHHHWMHHDND
ncbi:MAG TPA: hypothetical protein VL625_05830 [Patescibacteria group bacterium]|nr:hypothetical protein [Patescibacteria group bacterium]